MHPYAKIIIGQVNRRSFWDLDCKGDRRIYSEEQKKGRPICVHRLDPMRDHLLLTELLHAIPMSQLFSYG